MIRPQDAWEILTREIKPLEPCELPLEQALGTYLAAPILADADIPPADRAAMDGYAARAGDLGVYGARLPVDGEIAAGSVWSTPVAPGHCLRIFTGANLPPESNTVIAVEKTSTNSFWEDTDDSEIEILEPPQAGANVFHRGENARAGELLLGPGKRLGPRQIGLAAATGYAKLKAHRRPGVSIVNTGAELLDWAAPAVAHQTRNSNGPLLTAALIEAGIATVGCHTAPDELDATINAIRNALTRSDAVIITGGISAGRHDYVPRALEAIGARLLYRTLAMKPGKPQLFAHSLEGKPIFGLPGNPLSSIVGLYELVLPALRLLAGCPREHSRPIFHFPLAERIEHRGDRQWVCPAKLLRDCNRTHILLCPPIGSADLVTGSKVDGAVLIDPGAGVLQAGELVPFRPWGEITA